MKEREDKQDLSPGDEPTRTKVKDVSWPQRGRLVFGPWCLLGAWPAVFGMVEEVKENLPEADEE